MHLPNLHTSPKRLLIWLKLDLFLRITTLNSKNASLHGVLKDLNLRKYLEILNSNKTPNKFYIYRLKITFKPSNIVCNPFLMCMCHFLRKPFFHLFYNISTQAIYINIKLHTSSCLATLRAI